MSFTSALPTNLPKFSYVVVAPTTIGVTDSAKGSDFTSLKSMTSLDVSTGLEASKIKVPVTDLGSGLEFLRLTLRALESALGRELVTFSRKETKEIARGSDAISEKVMTAREVSRGLDLSAPSVFTAKHPKDALSECLSCLSALYPEIDYDKEIKAIHYNQPVRCILLALNLINYELQRLMRVGVRLEDEVYREVNDLWNRVNSWRTLYSGDVVEPEHENEIIDMLVDLEKIYHKLLKYKLLKGREVGLGAETSKKWVGAEVYLFNTGDWSKAKQYIIDYTVIFVDETIGTLPSSDVASLVANNYVVFVVMVDTGPYYPLKAPAFYNVFYTVEAPPSCGGGGGDQWYPVVDPSFANFLGSSVPSNVDYLISVGYKVSGTVQWCNGSCGYGYKKYARGSIIEVPWDGVWKNADWLGKYIDAISNVLLNIPYPLRILYLSDYYSSIPEWHEQYPADVCWQTLCSKRGWILTDLRG
jgi:hypothetical protein